MKTLLGLAFAILLNASVQAAAPAEAGERRPIPFKQDAVSFEEQGWQVGVSLLVLLVVATGALYLVRKRVPGAIRRPDPAERAHVVDRLRVDGRTQVYVVRFREREFVLAQSGENIIELRGMVDEGDRSGKDAGHE